MSTRARVARWIMVGLAAAAPATATAQDAPAEPPRATGVELSAALGAGSFTTSSNHAFAAASTAPPQARFGPGFGFRLLMGYRFHPLVSVGVSFGYQLLGCEVPGAACDAQQIGFSSLGLGAYGRVYMHDVISRRVEPWLGVGFDFLAHQSASGAASPGGATTSTTVRAYALNLQAGVDYVLSPNFALGLTGLAAPWFPLEACIATGAADGACTSGDFAVNVYWFAGASMRVTFAR